MDAMIKVMETAILFSGYGDLTAQHKKGSQQKTPNEKRIL